MAFIRDSTLAYKVVPAGSNEQGPRPAGSADILAITIHMAEGGGTVSWLTRPDGNSSHYVVEYDGRIVQMVPERYWAGSINPHDLRTTDDPPYTWEGERVTYGHTAVVKALGAVAARDPNRYVIAIEVEGFAVTGPNAKQRAGLKALVADIRKRRTKPYPTLGHRDFQDYKRCPGHRIGWLDYGGHAVKTAAPITPAPTPGGPTVAITGSSVPEIPTRVLMRDDPAKAGRSRWLYVWSDHRADPGNKQLEPNPTGAAGEARKPMLLTRFIDGDTYAVAYEPAAADTNDTSLEYFVKTVDILRTEPVPTADTTAITALTARLATANGRIAKAATDLGATPPAPI